MRGPLCDKQWEVIHFYNENHPKHLILEGAVRSGKTYADLLLLNSHIYEFDRPSKDFILTGYTIGSLERNIIQPLSIMLGRTITLDQYGRFDYSYHKVNCFGTDKENSYKPMQGMTSFGWLANEVTTHHHNSVTEAFQRCSGAGAKIFWETNPDQPYHPVKLDYIDRSGMRNDKGELLIQSFHFELEDNETLPPDYLEAVKRTTPKGMWYDRRIKGLWVAAEGIIYEQFNRNVHVIEPFEIPKTWRLIRGIDFGTVHPFVMLWGAIDEDNRLYIYREYYKTNTLIKNHAEKIKRLSEGDRYLWTVSDHDRQERLEYEANDIPTRPARKTVNMGLELVAQRFVEQVDGKPRIFIFNTCTELPRQLANYRWIPYEDGKPYEEAPLKVDDDGPDVLRYMIMELDYQSAPVIKSGFMGYTPRR